MSRWEWVHEFRREAQARGDRDRVWLADLHGAAYRFRETDPDVVLRMFREGRQLAEKLGEPWWSLFYAHWHVVALLHFKYDYRNVLDLAVRNALEARKPLYEGFPERVHIYDDLVSAYIGIDPDGYAEQITEALRSLEQQVEAGASARYTVEGGWREFALERDRWEEARESALRTLALADGDPRRHTADHYASFAYAGLCEVAFHARDWDRLREYAEAGEEVVRRVGHQVELSEFILWQALLARREGNEPKAMRLCRQAVLKVSRIQMPIARPYYDGLCAFHELGGRPDRALPARERELQPVAGMGRFNYESRCRLKRCELLARLGRPFDEELAAARTVAARLKHPEKYLEPLDRLARGEIPPADGGGC
ncbi:MAG TPA: hypothetical protein VFA26_09080 [Gemmataceae bacterium]|nr:hypothetical protein [Gemmataceae bacterium]